MLHTVSAFDRIGEENAFAVLARATALAHAGRDIINLGIGQPDFSTPGHIVEAAIKALRDGHHGYTPANGLLATREAVARRMLTTTSVEVSPDNVMIMPGGKPTMYAAILQVPNRADYDISSLRLCVSGGAALPVGKAAPKLGADRDGIIREFGGH